MMGGVKEKIRQIRPQVVPMTFWAEGHRAVLFRQWNKAEMDYSCIRKKTLAEAGVRGGVPFRNRNKIVLLGRGVLLLNWFAKDTARPPRSTRIVVRGSSLPLDGSWRCPRMHLGSGQRIAGQGVEQEVFPSQEKLRYHSGRARALHILQPVVQEQRFVRRHA
jgi:hypothetical protein